MLTFTPETLRAAYNYLNETAPFNKWNLPDGDDVEFQVAKGLGFHGWHTFDGKRHMIAISGGTIGHSTTLLATIAHEMVHVHERSNGACGATGHSMAFRRWGAQVCKVHGFDPRAF